MITLLQSIKQIVSATEWQQLVVIVTAVLAMTGLCVNARSGSTIPLFGGHPACGWPGWRRLEPLASQTAAL